MEGHLGGELTESPGGHSGTVTESGARNSTASREFQLTLADWAEAQGAIEWAQRLRLNLAVKRCAEHLPTQEQK
jgi:hypothetical protein